MAALADVACIVLAEGIGMDEGTLTKAEEEGIAIISTELPIFDISLEIYKAGVS